MALDFEKYNYELFQDWQKNTAKDTFITELKKHPRKKNRLFLNYYHMAI